MDILLSKSSASQECRVTAGLSSAGPDTEVWSMNLE